MDFTEVLQSPVFWASLIALSYPRIFDLFEQLLQAGNSPCVDAPWVLVLSWNEFVEQSNVEPDEMDGALYLQALRDAWK